MTVEAEQMIEHVRQLIRKKNLEIDENTTLVSSGLIDSMALIGEENEVAGNRSVSEGRRFADRLAGVIGPRQSQTAEAAGVGDRGGQTGIGRQRRLDDRVFDSEQLAHRRVGTHGDRRLSGARGAG